MKLFITGADGLLGCNITLELLAQNHEVTAFVHPESKSTNLDNLNITIKKGDLLDANSVEAAMEGAEAVIHSAANTKTWPNKCKSLTLVNVDGTKNIIKAAFKHKIQRLVYVGTANTFGPGSKEDPGNETRPYTSAKYKMGYMDSKYQAHLVMQDAVKQGLPAITVNPTFMFGPHDIGPSSGAMIIALHEGKIPGYTPGGRNYVYVKDVAKGICNALTMGRVGESYILGNENLSYKEAFELIAEKIGAKPPKMKFNRVMVITFGAISSFFAKLTGKAPNVTYPMARISCDNHYFSSRKAISELSFPQTPISHAIEEAYEWFKSTNKI